MIDAAIITLTVLAALAAIILRVRRVRRDRAFARAVVYDRRPLSRRDQRRLRRPRRWHEPR